MEELQIYKYLIVFNTIGIVALAFYYLKYIKVSIAAIINLELITFNNLVKLSILDQFDKINRTRIAELEKINNMQSDATVYDGVAKNTTDSATKDVFGPN